MKIMIAEDDESVRLSLKRMLIAWGFEVIDFANGQSAWDHLQSEEPPRLMLLDRVLPDIDGTELCRRIRDDGKLNAAYIIFLTVRTRPEDIVEGLHAGANDYVTKPFNTDELKARVQAGVRTIEAQDQRLVLERMKVLLETTGAAVHEVSQPLTVILGRAQRLYDHLAAGDPDRFEAEAIIRSAERIRDLLASLKNIQTYATKPYADDLHILDIEKSTQPPPQNSSEI